MGRYITGDIEHKLWFAVQNSDDADFFGVTGETPNYLEYYYSEEDLPAVRKGISKCHKALGEDKSKLDKFFEENNGYNNEMLKDAGIDPSKLEWYARLELGEKIAKQLEETGECTFEAEL